jgi:hypothetical protein
VFVIRDIPRGCANHRWGRDRRAHEGKTHVTSEERLRSPVRSSSYVTRGTENVECPGCGKGVRLDALALGSVRGGSNLRPVLDVNRRRRGPPFPRGMEQEGRGTRHVEPNRETRLPPAPPRALVVRPSMWLRAPATMRSISTEADVRRDDSGKEGEGSGPAVIDMTDSDKGCDETRRADPNSAEKRARNAARRRRHLPPRCPPARFPQGWRRQFQEPSR